MDNDILKLKSVAPQGEIRKSVANFKFYTYIMSPHEKVDSEQREICDYKIEPVCDTKDPEKANLEKIDLEAPKDRLNMIYTVFFLLGLVHFLPWSFFTTATEYWMFKFRNTTSNDTNSESRTELQATFNASLKVTFQITEIIFLILSMIFGRYFRVRVRLIGILVIILVLFLILTAFTKINTDSWQVGFFALVMGVTSGINALNALFSITMYTLLANFPRYYLAPYLTGGGLSKIFTASLQILSLTLGLSTTNSALVYFSMGVSVILVTLIALLSSGQNEFYLYHMRNFQEGKKEKMITIRDVWRLLKKIYPSAIMMGLFLFTMDASPTALVVSEGEGNGPWNDLYFIPTVTFLLTGIFDVIGRHLSFKFSLNISTTSWMIITLMRTILIIPIFMLCNAQPRHHLPVLLPHDYQYIIVTIVGALSGGYLFTRIYYNISLLVPKEELKHAYHVNMIILSLEMAVLSFVSLVSVKLL